MLILVNLLMCWFFFFFFNDTATTEIYTLSLHDALPICLCAGISAARRRHRAVRPRRRLHRRLAGGDPPDESLLHLAAGARDCRRDRKSTRLNSSHANISYAVFCLKKKKKK